MEKKHSEEIKKIEKKYCEEIKNIEKKHSKDMEKVNSKIENFKKEDNTIKLKIAIN